MDIHPAAAQGYRDASDAYERGRPGYPDAAVRHLIHSLRIEEGADVLDLGAGTGKFTRLLRPSGARLWAVEPVGAMRDKLVQNVPWVTALEGTAEAIPLEASSIDAVVVAQAFHWFDGARALTEIHRVLKPGGRLGLVWNAQDESVDWVAQMSRIIDPHNGDAPRYRTGRWLAAFRQSTLFSPLEIEHFAYVHRGPPEEVVVDRIGSISYIAALPLPARERVLAEVHRLLADHPQIRGVTEIASPYRTDVFTCTRLESSDARAP